MRHGARVEVTGTALAFAAVAAIAALAGLAGCGSKKPADSPEGTADESAAGSASSTSEPGAAPTSSDQKPPPKLSSDPAENEQPSSAAACTGLEMQLVDVLSKAACEVSSPKPDDKPREVKGILEVKAVANTAKVAPGGSVDVTVMFTNKSKGVLPLNFLVNPLPRFEIETYDAKGKRVDMPTTEHPNWPSGHDSSPTSEKTAQIKLVENGTGRVTLKWEAVKMKWAPEKAKGAASGSPYPRTAAGALPKGKYTLRVVTPLQGVFEGSDREVSIPKLEIEVGK